MIVRSPITAAAAGRVAAKLLPIVGPASVGYDIWQALNCKFENLQIKCDDGGPPTLTDKWCLEDRPAVCSFSPGSVIELGIQLYNQKKSPCSNNQFLVYEITLWYHASSAAYTEKCGSSLLNTYQITARKQSELMEGCPNGAPLMLNGKCPSGNYVPKSEGEAADHFGKNGPKVPGFVDKLPGVIQEGQNNGVPVEAGQPQVSGPPSVQGQPSVNTTNKSDGSTVTVTSNPTYNITYQGSTYTVNTVNNTTTVTTNPDGSTTTESTSDQPSPESVSPPSDPEMPAIPTLYEKKFPDGPSGVWANRKSQLQTTPIFSFLASLVPSTGDGGCPSWQLPVMYGIKNTSVVDISIPCWIWSAIRAIFVVTALLTCRRIIFGG